MTALLYEDAHAGADAGVQIWRCASCHCVHLRAGQVLLTFTPEEFATLTQDVVACYCGQLIHDHIEKVISDEAQPLIINSEETH